MLDVVVYERKTNEEVDRIATKGEREANAVLSGIRRNMSPEYRATVEGHKPEVKR
jgi:hypothetical protein